MICVSVLILFCRLNMKEELIDLVFNTPALWDRRNKQHHNRHVLTKEWNIIAKKLKTTVNDVRSCWKNLRQEFGKQMKKSESDDVGSQWPYFTKLLFLQDQFVPRETSSNSIHKVDPESSNLSVKNRDSENSTDEDDSMGSTPVPTQSVTSSLYSSDHAFRAPTPIDPSAPSSLAFNRTSGSEYTTTKTGYKKRITFQSEIGKQLLDLRKDKFALNDEDVGFFNSLLPHVRKLSAKDKFIFRMKVQQTLFELAFPQEQSTQEVNLFTTSQPSYDTNECDPSASHRS